MSHARLLRSRYAAALTTTWLGLASAASGDTPSAGPDSEYLGIFADAAATQTCISVPPGTGTTLYLFAFPGGAVADGIFGIEFRIVVTNPSGYFFNYTAPAGVPVVLGDPLDLQYEDDSARGAVLAYGECRSGDRVLAGTIQVFNMNGGPTELRVQRRRPPANTNWVCPLFVACDSPRFSLSCMRPCAVDEFGSAITARLGLNVPGCVAKSACPAACPGRPCVELTAATVSSPTCAGGSITVTGTATNCGAVPANIQVFVEQVLAASFTDVLPGQSVTGSRTYTLPHCFSSSIELGATATSALCTGAVGDELVRAPNCSQCPNRPPDCSTAAASVATLWPPDGRLVPVEIGGVTDPDGDPIAYQLHVIGSDERVGRAGEPDCPDAIVDGPAQVRLRAERDNGGDGRVYRLFFAARDPNGGECLGEIDVCTPRKLEFGCQAGAFTYNPASCEDPLSNRRRPIAAQSSPDGGIEVTLEHAAEGEVRIEVYDVRGRRIAQLANSRFAAGRHVVRWDGRDSAGRAVANGVYVVRLQARGDVLTTKAVLLR